MKKYLVLLLFGPALVLSQTKTWKLSTASEFSEGILSNTVVANLNGGEVRLLHPFVHQGADSLDSSIPEYVSYDDPGDYATAWISGERIYVQKFDANKRPLSTAIVVNDSGGYFANSTLGIALLNGGEFVVGWVVMQPSSGHYVRYAQFFDAAGNKIGANRRVFALSNATGSIPRPIADRINNRYIFVSPEQVPAPNNYHLYALLYSANGVKLRDSIDITPSGGTKNQYGPNGDLRNGRLMVAWEGENTGYGPGNIYAAMYDSNCVPITTPMQLAEGCTSPSVACDDEGNTCVTWYWVSGVIPANPPDKIYGQVLDPSMRKIGEVLQLSDLSAGSVRDPQITFRDGVFRLVYRTTLQWVSYWKLESILNGTYLSPVFDAGNSQTLFQRLAWTESTTPDMHIRFRLRSAATPDGIQSASWLGPTSDADYYTSASGQTTNPQLDSHRYLQAQTFFETQTLGNSPILNDFTVTYKSADSIAPAVPANLTAKSEHRRIALSWTPTTSPDVMKYGIYRTVGPKSSSHTLIAQVEAGTLSFTDSAVVYDSTYIYGVAAIDSSWNASPTVQSASVSPTTMLVFVSTSGSPQADGTAGHPFSQIGDAVNFSGKGDTVFVLPGQYNGSLTLKDNIALLGSGATATKIISSTTAAALTTGSNNVINRFTFLIGPGIVCNGDNVVIAENIFTHQGGGFDAAIVAVSRGNITIAKNFILNFSLGIQSVDVPTSGTVPMIIRNNIIRGSMGVQNVRSNISCVNNTFIIEGQYGYGISDDGTATILNNCFAGYPTAGSSLQSVSNSGSGFFAIQYNNRWNCNGDQPDSVGPTNIAVDPEFTNASKNNFHLQPASLCRNAGNPTTQYDDVDGSRNDIGAYGGPDPMPDNLTFSSPTAVSLNSVSGFPGDTVSVSISLSNPAGLERGTVEIHFDNSTMTFMTAATTNLTVGFSLTTQEPSAGRIVVNLSGAAELSSGSGPIAMLKFRLNATTGADKQTAIEAGTINLFDGDGNPISISSVNNGSCVVRVEITHAGKVFVDASYTGTSDGTTVHPWATIQQGIDNAKLGDTVLVAAGIYAGPIKMRSRVYLMGLGANITTIELPDDPLVLPRTVVSFCNVDSTGIEGFTLINYNSGGTVIDAVASNITVSKNKIDQSGMVMYSVIVDDSSRVTIRDNCFVQSKYGGFGLISVSMSDAVIACNVFSPSTGVELVSLSSAGHTVVKNNRFYLTAGGMVGVTSFTTNRILVANNLFVGTATSGFGVKLYNSDSALVVNNVFDDVKDGIDENSGTQEIYNNVFLGDDVATNLLSSTKHQYNLFWNNNLKFGAGQQDRTEIAANPLFVDQPRRNYKLSSTSPAINAGSPSLVWNDLDGTRNDIGIFGGPYADTTMFSALNSRLRIASVSGAAGDTIVVPVSAMGISGISGLKVLLTFDADRLSLLEAHTTALTQDFVLDRTNIGNSLAELTLQGSRTLIIDSGAVITLEFVAGSHATGTVPLRFQMVQLFGANTQTTEDVALENGSIVLGTASVGPDANLPNDFALYQNYPNPFNPSTTIRYALPIRSEVQLKVFDILGREVLARRYTMERAGTHEIHLNVSALSSGAYFYQLRAGRFVQTKKMLIVR